MIERKLKEILKTILFITLAVLSIIALFSSFTTIESGHVGVVKRYGAVQSEVLKEGIHFIRPMGLEKVHEMNTKMQAVEAKASSSSKDLQMVAAVVTIQYSVEGNMAPKVYQRFGTAEVFGITVISPAVQESVKAVTAKYAAEELISKRAEVKSAIELELQNFIAKTLLKENSTGALKIANVAITNFDFSPQFNASIEAKVRAEQEALKAVNEKKKTVTQAEAASEKKKLEADALAYKTKVESEARAKAIRLEAEALKSQPQLIELRRVEKWNGQLPHYMGEGPLPMLNVK